MQRAALSLRHRPAQHCQQGDRVGICVAGLDAKLVERGLAASPGTVPSVSTAIVMVRKVRFYRGGIESTAKCHVTVGHSTVMAKCTFFGATEVEEAVEKARAAAGDGGGAGAGEGGEGDGGDAANANARASPPDTLCSPPSASARLIRSRPG